MQNLGWDHKLVTEHVLFYHSNSRIRAYVWVRGNIPVPVTVPSKGTQWGLKTCSLPNLTFSALKRQRGWTPRSLLSAVMAFLKTLWYLHMRCMCPRKTSWWPSRGDGHWASVIRLLRGGSLKTWCEPCITRWSSVRVCVCVCVCVHVWHESVFRRPEPGSVCVCVCVCVFSLKHHHGSLSSGLETVTLYGLL